MDDACHLKNKEGTLNLFLNDIDMVIKRELSTEETRDINT